MRRACIFCEATNSNLRDVYYLLVEDFEAMINVFGLIPTKITEYFLYCIYMYIYP